MSDGKRLNEAEIRSSLRMFIINNFLLGDVSNAFEDDDSFLEKGIIDSTGVLELVSFVEETFRFKVKDDELLPDNLDSLDKLVAFVGRKTAVQ